MGQTLSGIQYALAEGFMPTIVDQTQRSHFLQQVVQKSPNIDIMGRDLYGYIHVKESTNWRGVGFRAEAAALPTASNIGYDRMYVALGYLYGSVQVTGQVEAAGRGRQRA